MSENLDELFEVTGMADGAPNKPRQDVALFEAPELGTQDYTEHSAGVIANALERTNLIKVIETQVEGQNQIVFKGRVKKEDEQALVVKVIKTIQFKTHGKMETYFGKQYFLKEVKGKLQQVFAWNCAFSGIDAREMARLVCEAIDEIIPRYEVMESPLVGPGTPSGAIGGKKGASVIR